MNRRITFIRRIFQIVSLLFIFYGGFMFVSKESKIQTLSITKEGIVIKDKEIKVMQQPINAYLPLKSCRSAESSPFRGCILFYISNSLTILNPIKIFLPHFVLFLTLVFCFGRLWCGWICPIGFVSDIFYEIRKIVGIGRIRLNPNLRRAVKISSYVLLILILLISILITYPKIPLDLRKSLRVVGCQICPARIIAPIATNSRLSINLSYPGYNSAILVLLFVICIIIVAIYLSGFVFKRIWCKLCPGGVISSLFNTGSLLTKGKDILKCIRCGVCADACPMETEIVYEEKEIKNVDHSQCIHCFRCVDLCPERNCLKVKFANVEVFKS